MNRPDKPRLETEADWVEAVQQEIRALDPELFDHVRRTGNILDLKSAPTFRFQQVSNLGPHQIAEHAVL